MKKLLIVFFCLTILKPALCQRVERFGMHIGLGYTHNFIKPVELNSIINSYNLRYNLKEDERMDTITSLRGISFRFSMYEDGHGIDWGIQFKGTRVNSNGTSTDTAKNLGFKVNIGGLDFGYSYMVARNLAIGSSLTFNLYSFKFKNNTESFWKPNYDTWQPGYTFFLNYFINLDEDMIGILIRPYYEVTPRFNFTEAAQRITSTSTPDKTGTLSSFGIAVTFGVSHIRNFKPGTNQYSPPPR